MAKFTDHSFEVRVDPIINQRTGEVIEKKYALSKLGSETTPYDIITESYMLIKHADVIAQIELGLLPHLPFEIIDEQERLYDNGAVLDYRFITDNDYQIDDVNLRLMIGAINSYDRSKKAGYAIVFTTDDGISFFPKTDQYIKIAQYTKHKTGSDFNNSAKMEEIAKLIPTTIAKTINKWSEWQNESLISKSLNWMKDYASCFPYRIAKDILALHQMGHLTRFSLYKKVMSKYYSDDVMKKRGFSGTQEATKYFGYIQSDSVIAMSDLDMNAFANKYAKFDWETVGKKRGSLDEDE